MESTNSTDLIPSHHHSGHLLDSKIFRNFTRLSRKKVKIILPDSVKMSELLESSDSGSERVELVNDVECTSAAHEWRKLVNIILPVSVEALRKELFTKSKFMDDFHEMKKHGDLETNEWERCEDENRMRRTLKYKMPLTTNYGFGPKFSLVTQTQTECTCCIPNRLYAVDVVNSNEQIPYGNDFEVLIHHCILSTIDDHSMYSVYGQVRFKKAVWGVVKSMIEKNCILGMDEFFVDLQNTLQRELCTPPSKGKRSSRKKIPRSDFSTISLSQPSQNESKPLEPQIISNNQNNGTTESSILLWLILSVLIAVVTMSTVLSFKLWALEKELSIESIPDYDQLRLINRSNEEWIQLLRTQQNLHETEVVKWLKTLEVAIELIQNTEKTLVELLGHIRIKEILEAQSAENRANNERSIDADDFDHLHFDEEEDETP